MRNLFKSPFKSVFLRVTCPRCKNKQIVFGKAASNAKCRKCGYLLIRTRGGKSKVRARVKEVL